MKSPKIKAIRVLAFIFFLSLSSFSYGEDENQPQEASAEQVEQVPQQTLDPDRELTEEEKQERNFRNEDAFLDHYEAVRSKQYVRRAILSSVISATNKVAFDRIYVNHLLGFHAIYQKTTFAKYVSGVQGLSVGYVTKEGHAAEIGMDFSSINNIFAGYRYFYRPENFLLWPFAGAGVGYDVGLITFAEGPPEAQGYNGKKHMGFVTVGILVPLVDVAIKAEIRASAYGTDRFLLTQGIGAILFF